MKKHINLNIAEPKKSPKEEKKVVKVMQFNLKSDKDLSSYEDILNNEDCTVEKEHLSFSQNGTSLVTLWWSEPAQK